MESTVQKWSWIAHLLFIAVLATLLASAVTKYIAIQLAPYTVPELPKLAKATPTSSKTPKRKPRAQSLSRPIVKRCLFGCAEEAPVVNECPDGCEDGQICQAGKCVDAPNAAPSELLVASDIGAKLLGAMVAANPDYSVALFSDANAKATFIVGIGEQLMGQAEVVDIRRDRVIIRRSGRLEYIKLENSLSGAPTLTSTVANLPPGATDVKRTSPAQIAKAAAATKSAPNAAKAAEKEVKEVADGEFELDGAAVNAELDNAEKIAKGAKVVPNYVNGKSAGIKLVGVRSDSVYAKLGIESGDVISSINGTKVKNQAHAFELLQKLRGQKNASIDIQRRGAAKKLKYKVK